MTTIDRYLALAAAGLMLSGAPAQAADQTILGRLLLIKDPAPNASPDPTKRKIKIVGKEYPSLNTIVGDPTVGGATLRVVANGMTNYDQTFSMPAAGWSGVPGEVLKYSDYGVYGPVRKMIVVNKAGSGKFILKGILYGQLGLITIEPPEPGTDGAAVLAIAGGDNYCLLFGGVAGGVVTNFPSGNPFKLFKVKNATSDPGCPP